MPKKKYSVELTILLEILKTNNPTQLQHRKVKELNQEEREIYLDALNKKQRQIGSYCSGLIQRADFVRINPVPY